MIEMIDIKDVPLLVFRRLGAEYGKTSEPQIIEWGERKYSVFEIDGKGFIAYMEIPLPDLGSKSTRFEVWHRLPKKNDGDFSPKIEIRGAPIPTGDGPGRRYHERTVALFPVNIIISENDLSRPVWTLVGEAVTIASKIASSPDCEKGAIYWEEDRRKELKKLQTKT